jgi:hypothetical protein
MAKAVIGERALAGCRVHLIGLTSGLNKGPVAGSTYPPSGPVVADEHGRVEIEAPPGPYELGAQKEGGRWVTLKPLGLDQYVVGGWPDRP